MLPGHLTLLLLGSLNSSSVTYHSQVVVFVTNEKVTAACVKCSRLHGFHGEGIPVFVFGCSWQESRSSVLRSVGNGYLERLTPVGPMRLHFFFKD